MLSTKDVAIVYETLLTSPGMNDAVKVSLSIQRKNVLLLAKLIEVGLTVKDEGQSGLLYSVGSDTLADLKAISADLLQKAGLTEMYDKLNSLHTK